jgi:hypothetical protein
MKDLASWAARKLVETSEHVCELKDLTGVHWLSGVDLSEEMYPEQYSGKPASTEVMRFVLDGVTFRVVEDPNDGYRSSMREIGISLDKVQNMFEPCEVYCAYKDNSTGQACDLLEMRSITSDQIVVIVGTQASDDYYPSFISTYLPENLSANERTAP